MHIKITKHADDKRKLLGITIEQIKTTIARGSHTRQTDGYLAHWTYIKVAYKKLGNEVYKVKTVFIA